MVLVRSKLGFSRPDLDGYKVAKGKYLARKARGKEVLPIVVLRVVNIFNNLSRH